MGFRKDFLKILNGEKSEDFPAMEFMGFWPECIPLYSEKSGTNDLHSHFKLDVVHYIPCDFNPLPKYEENIIEETETHITKIDSCGVTMKIEKNSSAMPHYIEFPIRDRMTYEDFVKRLNAATAERLENIDEFIQSAQKDDLLTALVIRGAFAVLRDFIKFEDLMMMFFDEPELIHEIIDRHADFVVELFGRVFKQIIPDFITLGEDMAYKNGSMISPSMIEEFIYPAWKKIIDFCKSKGVKNIILDSDGNIQDVLPFAVKAGFTCVSPLERAAGMDGEQVRNKYPNLAIIGGVDKLMVAKGKKETDEEIQKVARLYAKGRYIPSFDHSVPPIVSYENYKYYIENLKNSLITKLNTL